MPRPQPPLAQLRRTGTAGTPAGRVERDAFIALHNEISTG